MSDMYTETGYSQPDIVRLSSAFTVSAPAAQADSCLCVQAAVGAVFGHMAWPLALEAQRCMHCQDIVSACVSRWSRTMLHMQYCMGLSQKCTCTCRGAGADGCMVQLSRLVAEKCAERFDSEITGWSNHQLCNREGKHALSLFPGVLSA